jgi:hypothetical protein
MSFWDEPDKFTQNCNTIEFKNWQQMLDKQTILTKLRKDPRLQELRTFVCQNKHTLPQTEYWCPGVGCSLLQFAFFDIKNKNL